MRRKNTSGLACALAACALSVAFVNVPSAAAFSIGVDEPSAFNRDAPTLPNQGWVDLMKSTGSQVLREQIGWCKIAPGTNISKTNPKGTPPANPSDPNDPAYDWSWPDQVARMAGATGQEVVLNVYCAPKWAEGPSRPTMGYGPTGTEAPATGTWKPNAAALGLFAKALAKRYNGSTVDPLDKTKHLPRVKYFEAWNEVNYKLFLTPQCSKGRMIGPAICSVGTAKLVSPDLYRGMLNAFYSGIKAGQSTAVVLAGAFAPYGSSSYGSEIPPQVFMRQLLCLGGTASNPVKLPSCRVKAKFDAISFHPYTFMYTPTSKSMMPDGMALGNSMEVAQTLAIASSSGTVWPGGKKGLWVTEFGWLTQSPSFLGLASRVKPVSVAGAYTSESIFRLWAAGVDRVIWYGAIDKPGIRNSSNKITSQGWPGGLFYASSVDAANPLLATPKPKVLDAFRFPIFALRVGSSVRLWMRSACRGAGAAVNVEYGKLGRWSQGTALTPAADGIADITFKPPPLTSSFRATATDSSGCSMRSPTTAISPR